MKFRYELFGIISYFYREGRYILFMMIIIFDAPTERHAYYTYFRRPGRALPHTLSLLSRPPRHFTCLAMAIASLSGCQQVLSYAHLTRHGPPACRDYGASILA